MEKSSKPSVNNHPEYKDDIEHIGDGKEGCPFCEGRGVVRAATLSGPPVVQRCSCAKLKDLYVNLERGWRGLARAHKVPKSPLDPYVADNAWIRAPMPTFRAYLRRSVINMGPQWFFKVVTDVDIMNGWLSNYKQKGGEIHDYDVARLPSQEFPSLIDAVQPPRLLILLLGVKIGRNSAMPEVFQESLKIRQHVNVPTWIVDQPHRRLEPGHLCYSDAVLEYLNYEWEHYYLDLTEHVLPAMQRETARKSIKKKVPKRKMEVLTPEGQSMDEGAYADEGAQDEAPREHEFFQDEKPKQEPLCKPQYGPSATGGGASAFNWSDK